MLPSEMFGMVRESRDVCRDAGRVDRWTGNAEWAKQAGAFWRKIEGAEVYGGVHRNQGYCFNAGEWTFPGLSAARGVLCAGMKCMRACGDGNRSSRGFRV